jgi:predicted CXXCH cytochrome family protein
MALTIPAVHAQDRVSQTVHNLSTAGPGTVRAASEQQVCIFCHAPHNTSGMRPLWNRDMSAAAYTIYQSSTLDADPGQPTGASKLCLSCHDGTIALGSVLSRADQIRMVGGDFIPAGLTNLGTDLSDDHPVSFFYTSGLAASDLQLADPLTLPPEVRLDASGQLQCTACHNPHNNSHGGFLVMPNQFGALCTVCHVMDGWTMAAHRTSSVSVAGAPAGDWPYVTVAENACRSCHRQHTAGGRARLLILEEEEANCLICHDGSVASTNITAEIDKPYGHDPRLYLGVHDPVETPSMDRVHVECADCHNGHAASGSTPPVGYIPIGPTLANVPGINIGGAAIDHAQYEYEVCFRCHADYAVPVQGSIARQSQTSNLRLRFSPSNPSFHPVVTSSPNPSVSLVPSVPTGSLVRCTDCHNSDTGPRAGGTGPDGPHGSVYDFLLALNYTTRDDTMESAFEYALCYKCHERTSILNNESFAWHRQHLRGMSSTPCSTCHDPHGISSTIPTSSDHTHLINFDTTIVLPSQTTGRIEFVDLGTHRGACTLLCHGHEHDNADYPP